MSRSQVTTNNSSTVTQASAAPFTMAHDQTTTGNSVKQERHDEAEIRELAAQMLAANKAKLSANNTRSPVRQQGQSMNILSFLTRTNNSVKQKTDPVTNNTNTTNNETKAPVDEETLKGRFGWTTVGKCHIPYIYRGGDKYCAVRMVEMKVLNQYLSFLHQDIYNCICIRSYYITEAEGKLLNEINFMHCDYQYGRDLFTSKDLIVRMNDAHEFYKFLDACYCKLVSGSSNPLDRCGFIRINKESVVPYTIYNDQKYVPLFYFEGETDNLKLKANKLEGWDLSYLKFCCKVQGIRNELFAHDSCSVISLNDIKNYFPPGTEFEDYWPNKMVDSQLLINGKSQPPAGQWTRQPAQPPVTHTAPSPKPATNQVKGPVNNAPYMMTGNVGNYMNMGQNLQRPAQAPAPRGPYNTATRGMRPSYYPPPLVRTTQASTGAASYSPTAKQARGVNYMMVGDQSMQGHGYPASAMQKYPPPLIPVRHMNGGLRNDYQQNHFATSPTDLVDLSSVMGGNNQTSHQQMMNQQQPHPSATHQQVQHQQPEMAQPPRTPSVNHEERSNMSNGRQQSQQTQQQQVQQQQIARKLVQIPDTPTSGNVPPYKMQKAIIESKVITCMNMKPYVYQDLLVTLTDFAATFFNNVSPSSCSQVLHVLGIELYKGNAQQMSVLLENGKCLSVHEVVPLVLVRNAVEYLPQLKYMLSGFSADASNIAKRQNSNS